jgi:hypothetical protein
LRLLLLLQRLSYGSSNRLLLLRLCLSRELLRLELLLRLQRLELVRLGRLGLLLRLLSLLLRLLLLRELSLLLHLLRFHPNVYCQLLQPLLQRSRVVVLIK